jgi:DMSO/TMAO reductase YedYZ molybdopterin-dependent catalytic subunit
VEGEGKFDNEGPLRLIRPQKYEDEFNAMYCVRWVNEITVLPIYYDVDLSVDSTEKATFSGVNATYTLTVKNKGTKTDDYTLSISNPDNASLWLSKDRIANLHAGANETVLLNVTSTFGGLFRVNVTATSENDHFAADCVNTTTTIGGLMISGRVSQESFFTLTEIRGMQNITDEYTLRSGGGNHTGNYTGVLLSYLLKEEAGMIGEENDVEVVASDGYSRTFLFDDVNKTYWNGTRMILAYDGEGAPLDEGEGPLKLIRPQEYEGEFNAMYCVKQVNRIVVLPGYDVNLRLDSRAKRTTESENATYTLTVENAGTKPDNYTLSISNPDNASVWLSKDRIENLPTGANETALLNVTSASKGLFRVNVTATSESDPFALDYVNTTTTVADLIVCGALSQERFFDLTEIRGMQSITDEYTLRSGGGNHTGNYTGVLLSYLLKEAAGMIGEENYVKVTASDGYSRTFLFDDVNKTYWNGTRMILAYDEEGAPLDEGEGPLKLIRPQEYEGEFNAMDCVKCVAEVFVFPEGRLNVTGAVASNTTFTTAELRDMPYVIHIGNKPAHCEHHIWKGVSLKHLLYDEAGMKDYATSVNVIASDGYHREFDIEQINVEEPGNTTMILAYDDNGSCILAKENGGNGPLRLAVPTEHHPSYCVKWVTDIEVLSTPQSYTLNVTGSGITAERSFTGSEIEAMPAVIDEYYIKVGQGRPSWTATYKGVSVWHLLNEEVGLKNPENVKIISEDGYTQMFSIEDVKSGYSGKQIILAYEKNGTHLEPRIDEEPRPWDEGPFYRNGPLRLIVPQRFEGEYNSPFCVKWVNKVEVTGGGGGGGGDSILASIAVSPSSATLYTGTTEQFTATAYDQYGTEMSDITFT